MAEVREHTDSTAHTPQTRRRGLRLGGRAAVRRFQQAAVRLAWAGRKDGSTWPLDDLAAVPAATREAEAGGALVELAEAGDVAALSLLLRPDPARPATSWTLACYRIGDLVPDSLRDFTDPVTAVKALADCGDPDHMAAELVASTPEGLCWVVLVRTGDRVRFQLVGKHSILERPGRHGLTQDQRAALVPAQARWAVVLAAWSTEQSVLVAARPTEQRPLGPTAVVAVPNVGLDADLVGTGPPHAGPPHAGLLGEGRAIDCGESAPHGELVDATVSGILGLVNEPGQADQRWGAEVLIDLAGTLSDLTEAVTTISTTLGQLQRDVASLSTRLDGPPEPLSPGVASGLVPSPVASSLAQGAVAGAPYGTRAARREARHWWSRPKFRAARRLSAPGGTPAGPP